MHKLVRHFLGAACMAAAPGMVAAHGGLAMDQDMCKLTVGRYMMHFAGYQEDAQRSEFCEDIPSVAKTTIVLDAIDDRLRELPIGVRILQRQPGGPVDQGVEVLRLPARVYASGTLAVRHTFSQAGDYVGIVTAGSDESHRAVFPFSVGRDTTTPKLAVLAAVLPLLGLGGFLYARKRHRAALNATALEEV